VSDTEAYGQLVRYAHVGEVFGPLDKVRVIGRPHPLQQERVSVELDPGLTIAELLDAALGDRRTPMAEYAVCLDGDPVHGDLHHRVRVKGGVIVTFEPRLRGGDLGRSIAQIAVAVLAIVAAIFLPPLIGPIWAALAVAGITILGNLAINQLFPVQQPKVDNEEFKNRFRITGAQNQADPYGPIPMIHGKVRVWPRYGGLPFTSFEGEDQYLRLLFIIGYGPTEISQLKIGETDLADFDGVDSEILEGYDSDNDQNVYPSQVFEEALSVSLSEKDANDDPVDWAVRTTADMIDEINLDITAPQGIYKINSNGKTVKYHFKVRAEYRPYPAGGSWTLIGEVDKEIKKQEPRRWGLKVKVPVRGQYEVRVKKTSNDNSNDDVTVIETLLWTTLRGFRKDPPIDFHKPLAIVALSIKASGQLNSIIDTFNCLVESRSYAYNGSTWGPNRLSRNPADAFRSVLQGPGIYEAVLDEQIDIVSLEGWWQYCNTEGWEYNREHSDRQTVFEALSGVAAAGRARVTRTDGKWGVIWDEADPPVAQHFTPRNSWGFEEQRVYFDPPHALRCNFVNETKEYAADERKVYADGYDSSNATRFESMDFPGVTDPDNIWRMGRFHLAQAQLRPALYRLTTNWQALSCTVGDRVYVQHDTTLWGLQSARVAAVNGEELTLDEEVVFEPGNEYMLRFRQMDGTSVLRNVQTPSVLGRTRTVLLAGGAPDPLVGELVIFGVDDPGPAVLLRVLEIEWLPDLRARITMVDDAPDISLADQGAIPAFDSQITAPPNLFGYTPRGLTVQETVVVEDGLIRTHGNISWSAPSLPTGYDFNGFEVQMRDESATLGDGDWQQLGLVDKITFNFVDYDMVPGTYSFRVRTLFPNGLFSQWTELLNQSLFGAFSRPPDVTNFKISIIGELAYLSWDNAGLGVSFYTIRYSPLTDLASWEAASILLPEIITLNATVASLNGTYFIKAFNSEGVESQVAARITVSGANLAQLNSVEVVSPAPTWPGYYNGVEVVGNDLVLQVLTGMPASEWPTWAPASVVAMGLFEFAEGVDLGEIFTSRVSALIDAFGADPFNVMSSWGVLSGVLSLAGTLSPDWGVRLEERHAQVFDSWDPARKDSAIVLTEADQVATKSTAGKGNTFSTSSQSTGKYVFTAKLANLGSDPIIGVGNADEGTAAADFLGSTGNDSIGYKRNGQVLRNNSVVSTIMTYTEGDEIMVAVNITGGFIWFKNLTTGSFWNNSSTANPDTDTGGISMSALVPTSPLYAGCTCDQNDSWFVDLAPEELEALATEYLPWDEDSWTAWDELRIADITARAYQFRLWLFTFNEAIYTTVNSVDVTVDMPDRVEGIGDIAVDADGVRVAFSAPFRHLETVVITAIQDAAAGDRPVISYRDETGFDVIVLNNVGTPVARTVDAVATGYGRVIM
jgi:hypothetical protein